MIKYECNLLIKKIGENMDYLKLVAEIYLRQIGIDAVVTTVPKNKSKKDSNNKEKNVRR